MGLEVWYLEGCKPSKLCELQPGEAPSSWNPVDYRDLHGPQSHIRSSRGVSRNDWVSTPTAEARKLERDRPPTPKQRKKETSINHLTSVFQLLESSVSTGRLPRHVF